MERQKFTFKQFIVPQFGKKLAFMLPAVLLMGVFVSFLIEIGWGSDPATFMLYNISYVTGISLGTTEVIIYSAMLILVLIFGAELIGFGSVANMTLIGYTADFSRWIWKLTGIHDLIQNGGFGVKLGFFIFALICFVIVAAIYMNAQMGVAPYDALPKIISNAMPKVPFWIVRICFDLSAVLVGVLVSLLSPDGMQGSVVGSVAMSILLGPTITAVGKILKF